MCRGWEEWVRTVPEVRIPDQAPIDLEALDTRFMDDADIERLNTYHKDVYETISPYMNDEEKSG